MQESTFLWEAPSPNSAYRQLCCLHFSEIRKINGESARDCHLKFRFSIAEANPNLFIAALSVV
jgi:hypothetical protein